MQSNQCKKCGKALQEEDYVFMGYCENCYNQIHNISSISNQENTKSNTSKENKVKHKGYIIIANIFCAFFLVFGCIGIISSGFNIGLFPFLGLIFLWLLLQGIVNIVENTEK